MPHLNARGEVAHGVGGGNASHNNVAFSRGGVLGWVNDETIAFVDGTDDRWVVSTYHTPTKAIAVVDFDGRLGVMRPAVLRAFSRSFRESPYQVAGARRRGVATAANMGYAGGGHIACWFGSRDDSRGVYTTIGLRSLDAGLVGMGYDGSVGYKPSYQSMGPTHVRETDGRDWKAIDGSWGYARMLGASRVLMTIGFDLVPINLPPVQYANGGGLWKGEAAFAGGKWHTSYFTGARGIVLHAFDDPINVFPILPKGDGWHVMRELDADTIRLAIAMGEGEQAGQIWMRDINVRTEQIRDPWGANTWSSFPRVNIETINKAPDVPIDPPAPISGWFPRVDRFGNIVSGQGSVWLRGRKILDPGYKPQWLIDGEVIAAQGDGDKLYAVNADGSNVRTLFDAPQQIFAAGAGKWHVAERAAGEIACAFDRITGDLISVYELNGSNDAREIRRNGIAISEIGPHNDAKSHNGFVVWRDYRNNTQGWIDGRRINLATVPGTWEGAPCPIEVDGQRWLLFMTNVDIRLRPIDGFAGYIIATGEDMNFNPDAIGLAGKIRVTWNDKHGGRYAQDIALTEPRVDTRTPIDSKPIDPPIDPPEPTTMLMPKDVYEVYAAVARKFANLHHSSNDDDRREATKRGVETIHARIPNSERWQHKAAGPGNAPSKDAIANIPDGPITDRRQARMFMFDTVNGTTREPNPYPLNGEEGTQWIVVVGAKDWLEGNGDQPGSTHLYIGGGNDTNTCDVCSKSRFDPIHAIAESKVPHTYNGGEQDTGLCDVCQQGRDAAIHNPTPVDPVDPGKGDPTVDKHEFAGNGKFCMECGKPKADPIHDMSVPVTPGSVDMTATNAILRDILAAEQAQVQKLDELRTGVINAVHTFGADLIKAIGAGGLGGIIGDLIKKTPRAAMEPTRTDEGAENERSNEGRDPAAGGS